MYLGAAVHRKRFIVYGLLNPYTNSRYLSTGIAAREDEAAARCPGKDKNGRKVPNLESVCAFESGVRHHAHPGGDKNSRNVPYLAGEKPGGKAESLGEDGAVPGRSQAERRRVGAKTWRCRGEARRRGGEAGAKTGRCLVEAGAKTRRSRAGSWGEARRGV